MEPYKLRPTDHANETGWLVMVDDQPEWCATLALAVEYANQALHDAESGAYDVRVYVLKCLRQNR